MKVLLTGATGLLGHAYLEAAAARGFQVIALGHTRQPHDRDNVSSHQIDLKETATVERLVLDQFPDAIVNAAAISSPGAVEAAPELAEKLNVALPRHLAMLANHISSRFYHISTDMVFDGTAGPYRSTDTPNPTGLYGQMKLLAEREVLKFGKTFATVLRLPIIIGNSPGGRRSVHEKLFAEWAEGRGVKQWTNQIRQPVSATNAAATLTELCERPNLHGIFHWAGREELSRFEMARRICQHFALPETLVEPDEDAEERHFTLQLEPLRGKLRTPAEDFSAQLKDLRVPPLCQGWYESAIGGRRVGKAPVQRLVKGRDF